MSRRDLLGALGTAVVVGLAGCTAPGGGTGVAHGGAELPAAALRMEAIDDAELPTRVLYTVGIDGPDRRAELMDEIIDGGTTVERTRPPLPADRRIYYDDAVYQLSHEIVEETPATSYQVRVDVVQGTVTDAEALAFADLPAVDRERFAEAGLADGSPIGVGTTFLYPDEALDASALVPDPEYAYITWEDGSEAAWFVDDAHETTLHTYEYAAERHSSAAEYGQRMRERFAFELADLPEAEAAIVRTAVDEGRYTVNHDRTPSPAFWSLADRFRGRERARRLDQDGEDGLGGSYLVEFEGEVYWTVLGINAERSTTEAPS